MGILDGFWFWVGARFAELVIGIVIMVLIGLGCFLLAWWQTREKS